MDINIKQISENEYYNSKAYDIVYNGVGETYAKNIIPTDISESILLVAKLDKEIIGFVCGYNSSEYTDMININENINSTLKMIAIEPEYRGYGICTKLTKECLKYLSQPTISRAWRRSEEPDSSLIFKKLNFDLISSIENTWLKESKQEQDDNFCPDCGKICYCDSEIYVLNN